MRVIDAYRGKPGFGPYYMHVLNIQLSVSALTGDAPRLTDAPAGPLGVAGASARLKAVALRLLGIGGLCRAYRLFGASAAWLAAVALCRHRACQQPSVCCPGPFATGPRAVCRRGRCRCCCRKMQKKSPENLHIPQNVTTFAPQFRKVATFDRDVAQLVSARVWGA